MAKISIIVPVYNAKNKIRRCLDSIINQTFKAFECVIVNDGSTDGSDAIINEFIQRDSRFIFINKPNGGVSSARNKGLDVAKGEWIVFVDSDDSLLPEHLAELMQAASDDVDIVMTGYQKVAKDNTTEHRYSHCRYIGKNEVKQFIENTDFLEHQQPWDRAYRKKINVRFDERLSLSEDRLYCYHYLMLCKGIATIDSITYIHDVTDEDSLSYKKYSSSMNEYRYSIFKKMNSVLKRKYSLSSSYVTSFFKDYMEGIYACLINAYLDEGNKFMFHITRILYRFRLK